jgi:NAD(P)-dependent dehydrogenase (short-subunit alcohol dehydrogenase family)
MGDSMSKTVFLTGASAGFGFDAAKGLAERGHTVYATMRGVDGKNAEKAKALTDWATAGGHTIHVIEADVTSDASVNAAVAQAIELGGIDVVINNAGVGNFGIDEGFDVGQAKKIFDVNVFGVMRVNRAVMPHLRAKGSGTLVYVSSGLGRLLFPFVGIYASSKFALEGYAEGLSYEIGGLGIHSVIVEPGAYGTSFMANTFQPTSDVMGEYGPTAQAFQAFVGAFQARIEAGEMGDPSEVVQVLVEEVEREGKGPLRRPVGADMSQAVDAVNAAVGAIQGQLMAAMGG